jgi:hypothetical protein
MFKNIPTKKIIAFCFVSLLAAASSSVQVQAQSTSIEPTITKAQESLALDAKKAAFRAYIRARSFEAKTLKVNSKTNFPGRWSGTYYLSRNGCGSINSRFNFRHIIRMNRASTVINTSHDGTFYGRSRDGGKRLEVFNSYRDTDGTDVDASIVYQNLKSTRASSGFAAQITDDFGSCRFSYGATSYRS